MWKTCTFFWHRDCPDNIKPLIKQTLIDLIAHHSVERFYVGHNGNFDRLVRSVLKELAQQYPAIQYAVVLERIPIDNPGDYSDTLLPEGIENTPPRFAIIWRNRWMLHQADFVVTYITRFFGGAAQFASLAQRQKKTVINLASLEPIPK